MLKEKWYILDIDRRKLIHWNSSILYFDTKQSAQRFLDSAYTAAALDADCIVIKQYYNNSTDFINATNLICIPNGDTTELMPAI